MMFDIHMQNEMFITGQHIGILIPLQVAFFKKVLSIPKIYI